MSIKSPLGRQLGTQFDSVFDVVKSHPMYDKSGGKIPSLDLNFAKNKSLKDSRSTENKITFSRASIATYVGSDGYIKTTPVNLLRHSEQLDQWNIFHNASVTANAIAAPDGTPTADLIDVTAGGNAQVVKSFSAAPSTTYTVSFWAKSTTSTDVVKLYRNSANGGSVVINITNEWQRYTNTYTTDASSPYSQVLFLYSSASTNQYYVWGVQVEEGSTATAYIPTTSTISGAPRFDHDPDTGERLGLLVEESRTNFIFNSNIAPGSVIGTSVISTTENILSPRGIVEPVRKLEATPGQLNVWRIGQAHTGAPDTTYAVSFWMKLASPGVGGLYVDINDRAPDSSNITSQATHTEWFRVKAIGGFRGDTAGHRFADLNFNSFNTGPIYIWGAQIEEGNFVTSYIPTTSATVTRAADVAEITGMDFAKTNLLQYSERFDDATWVKERTTVTPNSITAPDRTSTAEILFENTELGTHACKQSISLTNGKSYVFSAHVKANSLDHLFLDIYDTSFATKAASFDLTTVTSADATGSPTSHSIVDIGDGWYRVSMVFTAPSTNSHTIEIRLSKDGNWSNRQYTGTGESLYVWGAQLEEGSVLTDYTPSIESFVSRASSATYVDDATGLIKTTPVNLKTNSEEVDTFANNQVTFTANQFAAPNGTLTADRVDITTANNVHQVHVGESVSGAVSSTTSVYVKGISNVTQVQLRASIAGGRASAVYDLVNGTSEAIDAGNVIFADSSITPTGNDWYRISLTFTTNGPNAPTVFLCFTDGNADAYDDRHGQQFVGTNESMAVWGAQVEEGLVMNDYIPTGSTISGAARYENGDLLLEEARTNLLINSDLESPVSTTDISLGDFGFDPANTVDPSGLSTTTAPDGGSASKLAFVDGYVRNKGANTYRAGFFYFHALAQLPE